MKTLTTLLLLASALPLAAAQLPVAIAPFTFAGRIVDYAHAGYDADAAVEIRLKNASGKLLAKTTTRTCGSTCYNYVLEVPVSTTAMTGFALVGEQVTFEFIDPKGAVYTGLVPAADALIGDSGAVKRLDVMLATDSDHDGVADEYLADIEYWMWLNGIEGPYDPKADYDGDGKSNYEEYLAGTNPCDPLDRFSIVQMAVEKGVDDYVRLLVPVAQGRSYSVVATEALSNPNWRPIAFADDPDSEPTLLHLNTGAAEIGNRVIFVPKNGRQMFYRVKVE